MTRANRIVGKWLDDVAVKIRIRANSSTDSIRLEVAWVIDACPDNRICGCLA